MTFKPAPEGTGYRFVRVDLVGAPAVQAIVDNVVDRDECNRPNTTLEGLAQLEPVMGPGNFITAGNASQRIHLIGTDPV